MKKLYAAAAAVLIIATLASCSGKGKENGTTLSFEEEVSSLEAANATTTENLSSIAVERDVIANEIGKSVPNEKLVVCITASNWYEYEVVFFDDEGLADYKLTYYFYNSREDYEDALAYKKDGYKDLQEKNKELMMVVDKNDKYIPSPYDVCYNTAKELESDIRVVIE